MEMDIEEMFGVRREENVRYSDSEPDNDSDDDGGVNNPMDEAVEVPEPGRQTEAQPIKPKRVIKNPQPKLDFQRLGGPRGIPVLQKAFKDVKWKGKGHEKEDLDVLLKTLEHWAHRMFPKLPFNNTLEQLEKLGFKKQVKVLITKLRLDMFTASELNGDDPDVDNVRRGIDDEQQVIEEPPVDIFDELLGQSGFPTSQMSSAAPVTSVQSDTSNPQTLTEEQKERLERNKRLAAERRLARLKKQQEEEERLQQQEEDARSSLDQTSVFDNIKGDDSVSMKDISNTPKNKECQSDQESDPPTKKAKGETPDELEEDRGSAREAQSDGNISESNKEKEESSDNEDDNKSNKDVEKESNLHTADDILDMIEDDGEK